MKHGNKILKIGRNASHRKATLQSMSAALLEHKRITTTFGKAKALRRFVEPIITRSKDASTHGRRQAFRRLGDKEAVKRLYDEIAEVVGDRPGGYTRIVKLGQRGGDAAEMAIVELVDFNDVKPEGSTGTKKKTRRSRRRGNNTAPTISASSTAPAEAPASTAPVEAQAEEADETPETEAAPTEAPAAEAEEIQEAEAVASDAADPDATGNPQIPQDPDAGLHPDTEQGSTPGTGEPPPEASPENRGRSHDNR